MAPTRIIIIRHAEKPGVPPCENEAGVLPNGGNDKESLTVRGWERAGALARFFSAQQALRPDAILASGIGPQSKSRRPKQTVTPLAKLLQIRIDDSHLKDDVETLMTDVIGRDGTVLLCWEHHRIPDLVAELDNPPAIPPEWPDDRFDVVWVLDRSGSGWAFAQIPQLLLAGDSADPIT